MAYQYLRHDNSIFRRPRPKESIDADTYFKTEIWDGTAWAKPVSGEVVAMPHVYGMEITEEEAEQFMAADPEAEE